MKVTISNEEVFQPINLELIFETQQEFDSFKAVIGGIPAATLEKIVKDKAPNLTFSAHSWMCVAQELWNKLENYESN